MKIEHSIGSDPPDGKVASRHLGDLLLLPASYCGLALLIVNDHYLKHHLHNAVSGKLSDIAGLVFFPLLVATIAETAKYTLRIRPWCMSVREFDVIVIAVGILFLLMKTWQPVGGLYAWLDAAMQWPVLALKAGLTGGNPWIWPKTEIAMDLSDLIALPALVIPWWSGRRKLTVERGHTSISVRPR